jgi:hypothetical protein
MDSKFVIEAVRWVMMESLRIYWQGDREAVASAIRELLQFDVPAVGRYEDVILVLRTDLTAEEEILILLHYAGEIGFSRLEMGRHARVSAASVTEALKKLVRLRQAVQVGSGNYRLTDLGSRRIREDLSAKLSL